MTGAASAISTAELRAELLSRLAETSDRETLLAVAKVVGLRSGAESAVQPEPDWWDELSPQRQSSILRGVAEANAGRVVSSEEMKRQLGFGK